MKGPPIDSCPVCGASDFTSREVLWPGLVAEWNLSPEEVRYIDRQQGLCCSRCGNNLRSMALAAALIQGWGMSGTLLAALSSPALAEMRILELNAAGGLTPVLKRFRCHSCLSYPEIDLHHLDLPDAAYDVVIHSDTLEHLADPGRALTECLRVLAPDGFCAFTVPVVVGRMSRSRKGEPASYHGEPDNATPDLRVHTEFGADVWTYVLAAGFRSCMLTSVEFPAGLAVIARR
jgi:SAM-dependent methyltransferase